MLVLALSSGTSVDAVDVALVKFHSFGPQLQMQLLEFEEVAWPSQLRHRILGALPPAKVGVEEVCQLDTLIGQYFAQISQTALTKWAVSDCDVIASHGQTVFHWVEKVDDTTTSGSTSRAVAKGTLQLGNPSWIVEKTGIPVISDLRSADIAAGGQGAPLASTLDALWLSQLSNDSPIAAVNIGGISNVTVVQGNDQPVFTWDVGPGNCLIDSLVQERSAGKTKYDVDGRLSDSGTVNHEVLDSLLADPYYSAPLPKSTGRELFNGNYLANHLGQEKLCSLSTEDLAATLTELTARTIAEAITPYGVGTLIVSGGGAANLSLKRHLSTYLGKVMTSDELGIPANAKEGCLFALLGYLSACGLSGTVVGSEGKQVTGASHPAVLGSLTPAHAHINPGEVKAFPTSLHVFKENNNVK